MKRMLILASLIGLVVTLAMGPAHATIITQGVSTYPFPTPSSYLFPTGSLVDFTAYSYLGSYTNGPEVLYNSGGTTVTLTVSPTEATWGNAFLGGGYWYLKDPATPALDGNGYWGTDGGADPLRYAGMMGMNPPSSGIGSLIFTFNQPVKAVGAFMNYWSRYDVVAGDVTIAALDQFGTVTETYNISSDYPILTPGAIDQGAFRGIYRSQADIYGFVVSNSYAVLTDLRFDAVPLPPSVWLLGSGLLALLGLRKRIKK